MNLDSLVNWVAGPPAGADGGDDPSLGDASPQGKKPPPKLSTATREELQGYVRRQQQQIKGLRDENEGLLRQLQEALREGAGASSSDADAAVQALRQELAAKAEAFAALEERMRMWKEKVKEVAARDQATIQDLQGQVQRLQQAGAAVPDLFAIPAAELEESRQREKALQDQLVQVKEKAKFAVQKLRDDLDVTRAGEQRLQGRLAELQEELRHREAEGDHREQLAELQRRLADAEAWEAAGQQRLHEVEEGTAATVGQLRSELEAAEQVVLGLRQELAGREEGEAASGALQEQLAELQRRLADAEAREAVGQQRLHEVKEKAKAAVQKLRDDLDACEAARQRQTHRAESAEARVAALQAEMHEGLARLRIDLAAAEEQAEHCRTRAEAAEAQVQAMEATRSPTGPTQDGEATGADGQPVEVARGTGGAPGVSYAFHFYLDHLRLRQPPEGQDALRTCLQLLEASAQALVDQRERLQGADEAPGVDNGPQDAPSPRHPPGEAPPPEAPPDTAPLPPETADLLRRLTSPGGGTASLHHPTPQYHFHLSPLRVKVEHEAVDELRARVRLLEASGRAVLEQRDQLQSVLRAKDRELRGLVAQLREAEAWAEGARRVEQQRHAALEHRLFMEQHKAGELQQTMEALRRRLEAEGLGGDAHAWRLCLNFSEDGAVHGTVRSAKHGDAALRLGDCVWQARPGPADAGQRVVDVLLAIAAPAAPPRPA